MQCVLNTLIDEINIPKHHDGQKKKKPKNNGKTDGDYKH